MHKTRFALTRQGVRVSSLKICPTFSSNSYPVSLRTSLRVWDELIIWNKNIILSKKQSFNSNDIYCWKKNSTNDIFHDFLNLFLLIIIISLKLTKIKNFKLKMKVAHTRRSRMLDWSQMRFRASKILRVLVRALKAKIASKLSLESVHHCLLKSYYLLLINYWALSLSLTIHALKYSKECF
jgi:hypothetical protein